VDESQALSRLRTSARSSPFFGIAGSNKGRCRGLTL
jgi:hypothetical protein